MPQLRLALAQVNPTVGDIAANTDLVRSWTARAAQEGAHLVVFPETVLTGYPVEDLALRSSFVDASRTALEGLALQRHAAGLGEVAVVVGYLDRVDLGAQRLDAATLEGTELSRDLAESGLDFTIVRPVGLTDEEGTRRIDAGEEVSQPTIPREDVAGVIAEVLAREETIGKTFQVSTGGQPISEALDSLS